MFDLTLITPTGDRPEAFRLCERWVAAQSYLVGGDPCVPPVAASPAREEGPHAGGPLHKRRIQWLVIDDGRTPTVCTMGQQHVRREPDAQYDPPHTLAQNLRVALPLVESDRVLIIEDDDYYGPRYLETMMRWLDEAPLVGEVEAKYYHVRYPGWFRHHGHNHASLCRTGFRREVYETFARVIADDHPSVDLRLWREWRGARHTFVDAEGDARLCVGMKAMPGREGATWRHTKGYERDAGLAILKRWVGDDWTAYAEAFPEIAAEAKRSGDVCPDPRGWRVSASVAERDPGAAFGAARGGLVVYTALFAGYDALREPPAEAADAKVRFACLTDGEVPVGSSWARYPVAMRGLDPWRLNRWHKTASARLFPAAAFTLYVDASIEFKRPASEFVEWAMGQADGDVWMFGHNFRDCVYDEAEECLRIGKGDPVKIRAQVERYRELDHPFHAGLWQGGVILRRNTARVARLDREWWSEIAAWSHRDQLSFPVALRRHPDVRLVTLPAAERDTWFTLHHRHEITERDVRAAAPAAPVMFEKLSLDPIAFGAGLTTAAVRPG